MKSRHRHVAFFGRGNRIFPFKESQAEEDGWTMHHWAGYNLLLAHYSRTLQATNQSFVTRRRE
jgi:hypothetical protein